MCVTPTHVAPAVDVHALLCSVVQRSWQQEHEARPSFKQLGQQLDLAATQLPDVFISFRFGEAHTEALALKAALEALGLNIFLSDASPGHDLQEMVGHALANCKLAIILATKTYGRKTNALSCTSVEMNFIVGNDRKEFFLVRMIPIGDDWAEPLTTMAFPSSIMFKLWLPGEPMPDDLMAEVCESLRREGVAVGAEPPQVVVPRPPPNAAVSI